jgi:ATP-dependent DNA helicase RecQ
MYQKFIGGNMTNIQQTLKEYYGYESFRPGQEDLIQAIINGQDVLGIMPTGGGKSLCYQIPAIVMDGLTLVVSPLISLMKDQVDSLQEMGVNAAYLNSQLSFPEQQEIIQKVRAREIDLLYVSPERLENEWFLQFLTQLPINLVAVDEAHCVSQWGHDFRPSYQAISRVLDILPMRPTFAAFTATATSKVQADIIQQLQLNTPYTFVASFNRPNLYFSVVKPKKKNTELTQLLDKKESSIIYCNTRKNVEKVYQLLEKAGFPVTYYHAGISAEERMRHQEEFLFDRKPIMVATNAFGMGIDKSNVRRVVHYNMPLDMESYYQEAGRAGRDGAPSEAILFYSAQDIITNTMLIEQGNSPHAKDNLQSMISYCKTGSCLRKTLLNYFNEEVKWHECEQCSNCDGESIITDVTVECQKILSCIYRMNQMYGTGLVTDVLRGKNNQRIRQMKFEELSTYGIMKDYTDGDIKDIISIMISEGYLKLGGDQYPILQFTEKTSSLLQAEVRLSIRKQLKQEPVKHTKTVENVENYDEELFEELRALRSEIAQEIEKPPFVVFTDRSLIDMAAKFPQSKEEFLEISGVGEAKLNEYGEDFLAIIKAYINKQQVDVKKARKENISEKEVTRSKRTNNTSGKSSFEETVQYFKENHSITEIAEKRQLSENTIVTHLCKWIEQGKELDISCVVSEEGEKEIKQAIEEVGQEYLKPIKEVVSEAITYDAIKLVLAKLKQSAE